MTPAAADRILSRYPQATPLQRWHMRGRLHLCPYDALLPHLTGRENLLDIGCGFGHLAWYLADARPDLRYHGTDIDARKIALAQACPAPAGPRPEFYLGDAPDLQGLLPERFGNIVLLDVLYLLPWSAQARLLDWALGRLAPGPESALVVKTMDEARGFSGFRTLAEEWIMVRLLRRTLSSGTLNGMRPFSEYQEFARVRGFRCDIQALGTFNPSSLLRFHR